MAEQAGRSLEMRVDLTTCDQEPIHIPGAIQGHGALVALDEPGMMVTHVSANVREFVATEPLDAIGKPLAHLIGSSAAADVGAALQRDPLPSSNPVLLTVGERTFDGILHRTDGATILELEPYTSRAPERDVLRPTLTRLQSAESVPELFARATAEIRALTGFDRVMLYRFQADGHGEVVAEARAPEVDSYQRHHFPASDIPAQARRLYVLDWIRIIPDIDYAPVPLVPLLSSRTGQPLDLSLATLRSVSPVHIEYLRNMGVQASMSVSLVRGGRLWGLFACHHREPRHLPFALRVDCEVIGRLVSLQASALAEMEAATERSALRDVEVELFEAMRSDPRGWTSGLASRAGALLRMLGATGAAICDANGIQRFGEAPTSEEIAGLLAWLSQNPQKGTAVFETDALAREYAPAHQYAGVASGLLAITIAQPRASRVLWFRRELLRTVTWAGDPSKPVLYYGDRIHPRRSFSTWVEEVRGLSSPWRHVEVEIVEDLRRHIVEIELERARKVEEQLRSELEQVTRAVTTVSESITILPHPDVSAVLTTLALEAQTLTGATYAAVGIGTDPEKPFEPWISVGLPPETVRGLGPFPRPVGLLGEVACQGHVIRLAYPRVGRLPRGHFEITSLLGVPLRHGDRPFGSLYLANKVGGAEFSAEDERKIELLAARAAVAVVTAQLYANEAHERTWLTATINQIPEGVVLIDRNGRIVALNSAAAAFVGETRGADPFGNPTVFDLRLPDGSPLPFEDYPLVRALRRGEVTLGRELSARVAGGRLVPILSSAAPVQDAHGEIVGASNLVQDITKLKELDRLREEWSSGVAHDLKQPVSTIAFAAQMLLNRVDGRLPDTQRRAVERIQLSAARLERMIGDLLHASLIEAKHLPLERRQVDLALLIDGVVEGLRDILTGHRVDVVAERNQCAWVDPVRIQQVLDNLISNAAKYGTPGTPIRVDCIPREHWLEVTVTNLGAGIPADELPNVFSRFHRAARARSERIPGLGLGLYITRGLVEAHGGRIWVESVPDGETSFHFTLPRTPRA